MGAGERTCTVHQNWFLYRRRPSAFLFTKPFRFASLHIGSRFGGRKKLTPLKLPESPFDFLRDLILMAVKPFILRAEHFQRPGDDLIGILVRAGLNGLRDSLLVLWT